MIGISVGGDGVTLSTGVRQPFKTETPRDLVQRVGTNTPYVRIAGDGDAPQVIAAHTLFARAVIDATQPDDDEADRAPIAVAVPGWWSPSAVERVQAEFAEADIDATLVNHAEAAIVQAQQQGHAFAGTVAVVSLRREESSVVFVRDTEFAPAALLTPTRVLDEGGAMLDAAVLQHLVTSLTNLGDNIDTSDPAVIDAARAALTQSRALREELSSAVTSSVIPDLPGAGHRIRIVRGEIEQLASAWIDATVNALRSAAEESGAHVSAVLVTGGLASMPLVSQRLSADLALELCVPDDAELLSARGAAAIAESRRTQLPRRRFTFWRPRRDRPITRERVPGRAMLTSNGAHDVDESKPTPAIASTGTAPADTGSVRPSTQSSDQTGDATELEDFLATILGDEPIAQPLSRQSFRQKAIAADRLVSSDER